MSNSLRLLALILVAGVALYAIRASVSSDMSRAGAKRAVEASRGVSPHSGAGQQAVNPRKRETVR